MGHHHSITARAAYNTVTSARSSSRVSSRRSGVAGRFFMPRGTSAGRFSYDFAMALVETSSKMDEVSTRNWA